MSDYEVATVEEVAVERRFSPALIGLAVLVAMVGVFLLVVRPLLVGDEPQATEQPPAVLAAAQEDVGNESVVEDGEVVDLPLVTYEVFLARDPFDPVVPEPVETAATDGTATDGTTPPPTDGTTPPPTDGTTPPPTDGTTPPPADGATPPPPTDGSVPPPPSGCSTGDDVSCDGRIVGLVEVAWFR